MSKSKRNTATNRRAHRPDKAQRPYKPIPVITEQFRGKALTDAKVRLSLVERLKSWGRSLRRLFGRKKRRRIETKTIKSNWRKQSAYVSQEERDRGIRKSRIKARNRARRRQTRALHQMERRRV